MLSPTRAVRMLKTAQMLTRTQERSVEAHPADFELRAAPEAVWSANMQRHRLEKRLGAVPRDLYADANEEK